MRIVERSFDCDFLRDNSDEKEMESLMQGRSRTFCSSGAMFMRNGISGISFASLSTNTE